MSSQISSFPPLHYIKNPVAATLGDLDLLIQSFPVIDNHAHNLFNLENASGSPDVPFESITSEAHGAALTEHVHTSLSHSRAMKLLSQLYSCSDSLSDIKSARHAWVSKDFDGLIGKCLEGTHGIMMDDGLNEELVHSFKWHRKFVNHVSRIVRIEALAAELLHQLVLTEGLLEPNPGDDWERDRVEALFVRFDRDFRDQIRALTANPDVRGFKSVICYRTGLDVELASKKAHCSTESKLLIAFHEILQGAVEENNYRIEEKAFNDYLVLSVCDCLDESAHSKIGSLPFQFHTGLGDSDITLLTANPAYMQPLLEAFPIVNFVLLHSSYPYVREAGYLASAYPNAWLDIGEVFPMLSRDGQDSVLQMALELAPSSKILWSTDGHFFPETYWLANRQFRQALQKFLRAGVVAGDYGIVQAIDIAVDVMFWNSNSLYRLGGERNYPHLLHACGRKAPDAPMGTLVDQFPEAKSQEDSPKQGAAETNVSSTANRASSRHRWKQRISPENPHTKYIWLQFIDYTSTIRRRMVPIAQFQKQVSSGSYIGITKGSLRLLQDDSVALGGSTTGQFLIKPDLSTLTPNKTLPSPSASVQTWWLDDVSALPLEGCPRSILQRQVDMLKRDHDISILIGCEIEIIFMRPVIDPSTNTCTDFVPIHNVHSWSSMTFQQQEILPMIEEIVDALAEIDICIPQFHSEAAPGQWEFPLPPAEPLKAIDMVYASRDVIRNVARKHGLKATLHPRPYPDSCGNSCHTHFSLHGLNDTDAGTGTLAEQSDSFVAGVLEHLHAIMALTLPLPESYERVRPGVWAGGEYIAWGTQNRETPLRKCGPSHWELKVVDGISNLHLGIAAVLAAGLGGVRAKTPLRQPDCTQDPSQLSAEQRRALGIHWKLPARLEDSLGELERDDILNRALGVGFIGDYVAVKRAEMGMLGRMGERERRRWLIERY